MKLQEKMERYPWIGKSVKRWWLAAAFPLCFVFGDILNLLFFYLGLAYQDNPIRKYGFILGCVCFATLCGLTLLWELKRSKLSKTAWIFLTAVVLFYITCLGVGIFKFQMNSLLLKYAEQFIVLCLPGFFIGIYVALRHAEENFFLILEKISFFVFPGAIVYLNGALFNCSGFTENLGLGIINYMGVAYLFMPFLLAHIMRFAESAELVFWGKQLKRPQRLRGVMIFVYWTGIIATGTRGAYVCIAGFCGLLVLSKILHREKVRNSFCISVAMAALLLFNIFIYAPPGMIASQRMVAFLDGLQEGKLVTSNMEDPQIARQLDALVAADGKQQVTNRPGTPPETPETPDVADENFQVGNRGTLYKLAIKEFQKAPLTGMGPGGYSVKYGMYPHNVLLELLCETGVLGAIPLLLVILFAFGKMLVLGWREPRIRMLLLFFMAYAIQANISGALWACAPLLCALGYALALPGSGRNIGPKGDVHNKI